MRTFFLFLVSSLTLAACGGDVTTLADSNRHEIFSEVAQDCQTPPETVQAYQTEAELQTKLVGRWVRCLDARFPGEDIGVEFTADHQWYSLTLDAEGNVIHVSGIENRGHWTYYPAGTTTPMGDVNDFDDFGFQTGFNDAQLMTSPPMFLDSPAHLRVSYTPWESRYVRLR